MVQVILAVVGIFKNVIVWNVEKLKKELYDWKTAQRNQAKSEFNAIRLWLLAWICQKNGQYSRFRA